MQSQSTVAGTYPLGDAGHRAAIDGNSPGVSWGAVLAGAAAAAALSFILLILGFGLGLSAVSPWSYNSAETLGTATILWLAFMQLASAGIGGYLAGRLRVKWAGVHNDEAYFRDTAHGLLAWAVATLLTAALMAGAVRAVLGGAIDAGAAAAGASAQLAAKAAPAAGGAGGVTDYFGDVLLRTEQDGADDDNGALRGEVGRIFANDPSAKALAPDDRQYLARLVAKRTGLTPAEAERRVDDVYARLGKARADAAAAAKQVAETARKAAAYAALWMFVALCLGAFCASLCATIGGRQRDDPARR